MTTALTAAYTLGEEARGIGPYMVRRLPAVPLAN